MIGLKTKMTKQNWDLNTSKKDIAKHLKEEHCYPYNDRRALTTEDFIFEHFPSMIKNMSDKECGYLTGERRKQFTDLRKLLQKTLKFCEEEEIPITKVLDINEDDKPEWRICKPSREQLNYLKFTKWFASAEGYFNKAVLQENMLGEVDVDLLMEDLKETIEERQKIRLVVKEKKRIKNESATSN